MVLLVILGFVALLVVSSIFNGYVLSVLWGWFIIPVFNLPELTVVPAIGIAMVVSYLTYQYNESDESDDKIFGEKIGKLIVMAILRPLLVLFFGWIVHLFM